MNNSDVVADVLMYFDGELMGAMQSLEYTEPLREIKDGDNFKVFNNKLELEVENFKVNDEFLDNSLPYDGLYTVVCEGYLLPRGVRLPKKKRIQNKWKKKYVRNFTLERCSISI